MHGSKSRRELEACSGAHGPTSGCLARMEIGDLQDNLDLVDRLGMGMKLKKRTTKSTS